MKKEACKASLSYTIDGLELLSENSFQLQKSSTSLGDVAESLLALGTDPCPVLGSYDILGEEVAAHAYASNASLNPCGKVLFGRFYTTCYHQH